MDARRDEAILVRDAVETDAPAIAEISRCGLAELRRIYRPTPRALWRRSLGAPLPRLVAVLSDRVVGTVCYRMEADAVHAVGLYTHPDFRRRGVARALLDRLAETAVSSGRSRVSLNTIVQTGNVGIFERIGFRVVREFVPSDTESVQSSGIHEALMVRVVSAADSRRSSVAEPVG